MSIEFCLESERPLLADSRSLENGFQRLLLRKRILKLDESAAITDPEQTSKFEVSGSEADIFL